MCRMILSRRAVLLTMVAAIGAATIAAAQTPPIPRRSIAGVWMKQRVAPGPTFDTATWTPGIAPRLTPWGLEQRKANRPNNSGEFQLKETNDPVLTKCYPPGTPRVYFHPYPFEIVPTAQGMIQLFEYDHIVRRLYVDGRPLPADPDPLWMGTSAGRWVDDFTFEVVTVGINTRTWLDRAGTPHSEQLKVTEVFRRTAHDRLQIDFLMEDPIALAAPWRATGYFELRPDWALGEISCSGDYFDYRIEN